MDKHHADLQDLFRILETGTLCAPDGEDRVSRISSAVRHGLNAVTESSQSAGYKAVSSACMCLTAIGKIISRLCAKSLTQDVRSFYEELMKRLFSDTHLISGIVSLLKCRNRLVSHLSAKCVSSAIFYDVCIQGKSTSVWKDTFTEMFPGPGPGPGFSLDSCLWTLTDLIKRILRGDSSNKTEILLQLLSDLQPALTSLYSNLLSHHKLEQIHKTRNAPDFSDPSLTLHAFLELLEALTAARLRSRVSSPITRLIFLHTSVLLRLHLFNLEFYVKKRMLLLLKRTLTGKAGEDWALGGGPGALGEDEDLSGDVLSMADAVLQEVDAGWLGRLSVKSGPAYFGGNRKAANEEEGCDTVVLRAASLVLIKCLEINTRRQCGEGSQRLVDVRPYMRELLSVLQLHVPQYREHTHPCTWFLLVFAEQDDDMMESAKALTALYLHHKSLDSPDPAACEWGCNPHCHFILLLQSLSFDHTVLLDFLISSETCFLEYVVVYLKLLRNHWRDFCQACRHLEGSDGTLGSSRTSINSQATTITPQCQAESPQNAAASSVVPRLVDYETSEESGDEEEKDSSHQITRNAGIKEAEVGCQLTADCTVRTQISSISLLNKVVSCLSELSKTVTRLHSKGLFPYNPTSLLKLLKYVETHSASCGPTSS